MIFGFRLWALGFRFRLQLEAYSLQLYLREACSTVQRQLFSRARRRKALKVWLRAMMKRKSGNWRTADKPVPLIHILTNTSCTIYSAMVSC
jgi:hypothetical protein